MQNIEAPHTGEGILGALVAVLFWIIGVAAQYGYNKRRWTEVDKNQTAAELKHKAHYEAIGRIERNISSISQEQADHSRNDEKEFKNIKDYLKENRDDTKQILRILAESNNNK